MTAIPSLHVRLVCLSLVLSGCPGSLENPERFQGVMPSTCELDVEADILQRSCATLGCHDSETAAVGLDLSGSGLAAGWIDRPAATMADDPQALCEGMGVLLDPANLDNSLMLDKLAASPRCGIPMPFGATPLPPEEIECIREYMEAAAGNGSGSNDAGAAPVDGSTTAGSGMGDGGV